MCSYECDQCDLLASTRLPEIIADSMGFGVHLCDIFVDAYSPLCSLYVMAPCKQKVNEAS